MMLATALAVNTACGLKSADERQAATTPRIPQRYENWVLTYSTGANEIRVRRLAPEEPTTLLRSIGNLDTPGHLHWLQSRSALVFERAVDGKTEIVKFSPEDGLQEVLSADATRFVGVRDDREVLFVESKGDLTSELWSHDLAEDRRRLLLSSGAVLPAGSQDASSTSFIVLASSGPSVEPFDHVLYRLQDKGSALRFMAAPAGSGFDQASPFRDGVLFSTVELGGETYGRVSLQSRDGKVQTLSERAKIAAHTDKGAVLLLERTASDDTSGTGSPSEGIQVLVYLGPGETTPRRMSEAPSGYQTAKLCGEAALASSYSEGEHRLDLIDITDGTVKNLFHSPTTRVSEIQAVDDSAAVCVFETISADGMVQESVLSFVPLDGSGRVDLDKTDSGFIHLATPDYCES